MTSCVREPPVVSIPLVVPTSPGSASFAAGRPSATCRSINRACDSGDVLASAARAARKVWQRGSVPRHLLVTRVSDVHMLPDVEHAYAAIARVIRHAKHEVLIQNYVWQDGTQGAQNVMQAIRQRCEDVACGMRPPWQLRIVIHHRGRYALPTASKFCSVRAGAAHQIAQSKTCSGRIGLRAQSHHRCRHLAQQERHRGWSRSAIFGHQLQTDTTIPPDRWYDNGLHLVGQTAHAARADWCDVRARRHTRLRAANVKMPPPTALPAVIPSRAPDSPCWW